METRESLFWNLFKIRQETFNGTFGVEEKRDGEID